MAIHHESEYHETAVPRTNAVRCIADCTGASGGSTLKDLLGASSLYTSFGIFQVRLHDSGVDLCTLHERLATVKSGLKVTDFYVCGSA